MRTLAASLLIWTSLMPGQLPAQHDHSEPGKEDHGRQQVVVLEYASFDCTSCGEVSGLLEKLASGKNLSLQIVFKHIPATPATLLAHEAALAAGQQGKFWEMHDQLFANPQANYARILELGRALKLDFKRFQTALDEREFRPQVMEDVLESRGLGIRVTPTLFLSGTKVEGVEQLRELVNKATATPAVVADEGRIYEFDLEGSPASGPADAPVTLVEFSDFRCGFCGVHSRAVSELVEAFPGKIRRVFKHFPIEVSADGRLPHLGSMAAMAQGRFWEMHRALMNRPLTGRDDLISRAVALGFDMERFERDLGAGEGAALIQRDVTEGDGIGIRMTPTTFINGRMLSGRQSLETLKERVAAILKPGAQPGKQAASHLDLLDQPAAATPAATGEVKCCGL